MSLRAPLVIQDTEIKAGTRVDLELPIAKLASGTPVSMPLQVMHGHHDGPSVWINAAIHGDEVGGVETVRRVLSHLDPKTLHGTVYAVPIVNVHGFVNGDRYLPDRRDLNRSFPGSAKGSLARRIAHLFMTEVVARCSVGIDLHTGSDGRRNLPQIRANLDDDQTLHLATIFGAPLMMHSKVRDGSLRGAASKCGATVLLFEGGEALRFDPHAIQVSTEGVLRVFAELGMIAHAPLRHGDTARGGSSRWIRAGYSGLAQIDCGLGAAVDKGQVLGRIHDGFGRHLGRLKSPMDGLVIGLACEPVVNRGDALVHIAPLVAKEAP